MLCLDGKVQVDVGLLVKKYKELSSSFGRDLERLSSAAV